MSEIERVAETDEEKEVRIQAQRKKELEEEAQAWDPEREAHGREQTSHKTVICYNSACPDYRRERTDGSSCACKRVSILGGGI